MKVRDLVQLLQQYPPQMDVVLYTGVYTDRGGEVWVETENFTLDTGSANTLYLEGTSAH